MSSGAAKAILALVVLILPFVLIYASGLSEWVGRAASVAIFQITVGGLFIWLGLGASGTLIRPAGKLAQPEFTGHRNTVQRVLQGLLLCFSVFFIWTQVIPFAADLRDLISTGAPARITAVVRASSGLPFFKQSVRLQQNGTVELNSYTYLYFLKRIESAGVYELSVAPRSRVILQAVPVAEPR